VRQAAIAMGFRPVRRLLTVELPIAIPVIGAGLRVAAVSNVSLVAVAALIGVQQLGQLFTKGEQLDFYTPIIAGIVLCALIAVVFDALILTAIRVTTPWRRTGVAA
jgi:osmoprotectant transport system permease protein